MSTSDFQLDLNKQVEVTLFQLSDNGQVDSRFEATMKWINTITDVRNLICQRTGLSHDQVDVIYGGKRLPKSFSLYQINVSSNRIQLYYICRPRDSSADAWIHIVSPNPLDKVPIRIASNGQKFLDALEDVRNGFHAGIKPELSLYGSGGTYYLNDCNKWNLLVFKPEDEEPFAENNPRRSLHPH